MNSPQFMERVTTGEARLLEPARLDGTANVERFVLGGSARFTLRSTVTGTRFTFWVRKPKADKPHFVRVLAGPEHYEFVGTIFSNGIYSHSRRSLVDEKAPAAVAFRWFWTMLTIKHTAPQLEIWHEGRCCRCGRGLTVPESIASGIGPECAKKEKQ